MGRRHYLTRLALGRSIYEDGDAEVPTSSSEDSPAPGHYVQRYDDKGNPTNPETEAFNKSMIAAHNDILALVGVVERKYRDVRQSEQHRAALREHRQRLLTKEQDHAELIDYLLLPTRFFSHLYLDGLLQRLLVGLYPSSLSFSTILLTELRSICTAPTVRVILATAFPALGDVISYVFVRVPLLIAAEHVAGRAQTRISSLRLRRKTARKLYTAVAFLYEAALLAVDILFLPIDFHTTTQRLRLTPALPLLPPWSFFSPSSPTSFHASGWKPLSASSVLHRLVSPPAIILLTRRMLQQDPFNDDITDEERLPFALSLTSFRTPSLTADPNLTPKPSLRDDPLGWVLYKNWSFRRGVLHRAGFCRKEVDHFQPSPLQRRATEDLEGRRRRELATASASDTPSLPLVLPSFLNESIASWTATLFSLPVETLLLRSIAVSFYRLRGYLPDAAGPMTIFPRFDTLSLRGVMTYTSRIGLCLALHVVVDIGIFAALKWSVGRNTVADVEPFATIGAEWEDLSDVLVDVVEAEENVQNAGETSAAMWQEFATRTIQER
ncbi:hypothetical protein TI39_contig4196g00005 [Zymoseptoria brevis]|uniref:Uncharacterized protein n=1 Tax=Zymoseptoria brevis TaxID=1047168 RepID=A0A0F4GAL9_9PEZI|nr:hypothetical protein TI39_contig4196g00005 [Zymoseptoria brevis]